MVGILVTRRNKDRRKRIVGIIVTERKVLTAAHNVYRADSVELVFGSVNLKKPRHKMKINKDKIKIHPEYTGRPPYANDIAVIRLEKELKFDSEIGKIKMVKKEYVAEPGASVIMLGYSAAHDAGRTQIPSNLRYVKSKIANFEQCRDGYHRRNPKIWSNRKRQFCVSLRDGDHNELGGNRYTNIVSNTPNDLINHILTFFSNTRQCTQILYLKGLFANRKSYLIKIRKS